MKLLIPIEINKSECNALSKQVFGGEAVTEENLAAYLSGVMRARLNALVCMDVSDTIDFSAFTEQD